MWGKKVSGLLQVCNNAICKRYNIRWILFSQTRNKPAEYLKKKENLTKGFPAHQPISSVILYEIKERKKKELFQEKFRHFESWKKKLFSEKSWFYKICAFRSVIFLILEFKFAKLSIWIFFENFFRCSALDNSKKIFHLLIPVPNILK